MKRMALVALVACAVATPTRAQTPPAGAVLDSSAFTYVRDIAPGPEALVELRLDAAVLAHSKGPNARFADLRIVDDRNRQVQYLLEPSEPLRLPVPFRAATPVPAELASTPGHNRSTYVVDLPYTRLPGVSLLVSSSARTFSRALRLSVERPSDSRHRDRWVEEGDTFIWSNDDDQPTTVALQVAPADAASVLLTVDEGDNAPLPISSVTLTLPGWRVRFYRPNGVPLRFLYGNFEASPPVYDIALLRAKVIGETAVEISAGPEAVKRATAAIVSPRVFWGFLIAAVVVLIALIARLATSRPSEGSPPPSAPRP